jgi:dTDP-4-dehydrorhamnose reductase
VQATLDLLVDGEHGLWHLANRGEVSWAGLARMAADAASLDGRLVRDMTTADLGMVAPRPRYSALASERGGLMPRLEDALCRYMTDRQEKAGRWPWRSEDPRALAA